MERRNKRVKNTNVGGGRKMKEKEQQEKER